MAMIDENKNLQLVIDDHIGETYKFLDPTSVFAFSQVAKRMNEIFQEQLPILMQTHFAYAWDPSMQRYSTKNVGKEYLRQAIALSPHAGPACIWRRQAHEDRIRIYMSTNGQELLSSAVEYGRVTVKSCASTSTGRAFFGCAGSLNLQYKTKSNKKKLSWLE